MNTRFGVVARLGIVGMGLLGLVAGCKKSAPPTPAATTASAAAPEPVPPIATTVSPAAIASDPPLSAPRAAKPVRVLLAGDVIAHRPILIAEGALANALSPLHDLFGAADGVLVNHESATGDPPLGKRNDLVYAAPPFWAKELAASRVTALGLANNHACDLGRKGLLATVASAKESSLVAAFAGEEPWKAVTIAERDGKRVCAVGWSTLTNGDPLACDKSLAFAPESPVAEARVVAAIADAKKTGCDAVVAIVHIGDEYRDQLPSVFALGARLADAGADAVAMHHPHVPGTIKATVTKDGRIVPVFPSLGNLVSNQGYAWRAPSPVVLPNRKQVSANAWTRLGVIADVAFTFDEGKPRASFGYHLVWNERPKHDRHGGDVVTARLVTRADTDLVERFGRDKDGPNALFTSPCWRDDPSAAPATACLDPKAPAPKTARAPKAKK